MDYLTVLYVVPFFVLGYFLGCINPTIPSLNINVFHFLENEEDENIPETTDEDIPVITNENIVKIQKIEEDLYNAETAYKDTQLFSSPYRKYITFREMDRSILTGNMPIQYSSVVDKCKKQIKNFFIKRIVGMKLKNARKYAESYGYILGFRGYKLFPNNDKKSNTSAVDSNLKNKILYISLLEGSGFSFVPLKMDEKKSSIYEERVICDISDIDYDI